MLISALRLRLRAVRTIAIILATTVAVTLDLDGIVAVLGAVHQVRNFTDIVALPHRTGVGITIRLNRSTVDNTSVIFVHALETAAPKKRYCQEHDQRPVQILH
jgi:hypothetical protein